MSESVLTNKLTIAEKTDFYNSILDNNLELFQSFIYGDGNRPPYDVFEELSKSGYNWMCLHYAMHYGKWEIIQFILQYLIQSNLLEKALKIKTNDNRCPMLCLLRSKDLNQEQKKDIYFKIINNFPIPLSPEVVKEASSKLFYEENKSLIDQKDYFLVNELTVKEKKEFYNSVIENNLELFKGLVDGTAKGKKYNLFEEVSAAGYRWTVFHYAMHYAKFDIIDFIIGHLKQQDLFDFAINLKTRDNRCPILCLLRSDNLQIQEKRNVLSKILAKYEIPISEDVKKELHKRKMDDLLKQIF